MKCNKCCGIIPPNEEIRNEHKYYCETCWKSDSWKRSFGSVMTGVIVALAMVVLFVGFTWIIKDLFSPKKDKENDE